MWSRCGEGNTGAISRYAQPVNQSIAASSPAMTISACWVSRTLILSEPGVTGENPSPRTPAIGYRGGRWTCRDCLKPLLVAGARDTHSFGNDPLF